LINGGSLTSVLIPFPSFIATTRSAVYSDYATQPEAKVLGVEEFIEMQAYILQRYANVQVACSLLVEDQIFDCIILREGHTVLHSQKNKGCPDGSIPLRRNTLEELTRFRTLRDFLGKAPGGKVSLPD
jgi:hypothetical protein